MTTLLKRYKGKTYRTIEWTLRSSGMPEPLILQTLETLRKERSDAKVGKLKRHASDKAWKEVIEPLQHERRIVRTMARYKTVEPSPEREDFVQQYNDALTRVYDTLSALKRKGGMPEHSHWTDYVPSRIKHAFTAAAADIPPRNRARLKQPFERTLPLALYDRRKGRLLRKTYNELTTVEGNGDVDRAEQIRTAIERIRALPEGAHVPDTWHSLVQKDELG